MTIKKSLSDSPLMRWSALGIVAFTMMAAYFMNDVMAPLKSMLETELLWNSEEYGFFTGAYSFLNVFLLMLIWGGLLLDRFGIRFTGKLATILMVGGAFLKYYGLTHVFPEGATLFGYKASVMWASAGYGIFGVGAEVAGITVTKIIAKWFRGKEMATAMGIQVALARIGSQAAYSVSGPLAISFGTVSAPVLLGCTLLFVGLIAFFIYSFMDKKLDSQNNFIEEKEESSFSMRDVGDILKSPGFWLIAVLCVLFYSCIFPFQKFATELMVNKYGIDPNYAGSIVGLPALGALFLTPIFGGIFDRKGKGATIMMIGAGILIFVHMMYAIPSFNSWILAVGLMVLLGIAFSLVPSAMWPSVARIFPEKQLGTAYALIFFIQNIGLWGVPTLIGWVLNKYCILEKVNNVTTYDYTIPMIIFTSFAVASFFIAFWLKKVNFKKGYGLENPNIQA